MTVTEQAIVFRCAGETLVGIAAADAEASTGVVIVVGGPQTRVGSHRYFVQLARALAAGGFPTLRFDYRGMGDSSGTQRDFERIDEDIGAAITALQHHSPAVNSVVLWGLCDGASAALLYMAATADSRVCGLCLLNPWVRSEVGLARTQVKHYYVQRLMQRQFWLKLFSGKVAVGAATGLLRSIRMAFGGGAASPPSYQQRMASALAAFAGPVLLLLSESDYTAKEFVEFTRTDAVWTAALARRQVQQQALPGADHTLSDPAIKAQAQCIIETWLRNEFTAHAARTTPLVTG
jgi:uncharacterized protein